MSAQFLPTSSPFPQIFAKLKVKARGGGGEDNWGLVHIWPDKFETEHNFLSTVILNNYTYVNPKRAFQNALRSSLFFVLFFQNVHAKESRRWSLRF